jgi:hypothetical protein
LRAGQGAFAGAHLTLEGPLAPGEVIRADVQLAHGATIRGRALENGQPLAGARVAGKDALGSQRELAHCDADGRYELAQVAPGEITLTLLGQAGVEPLEERRVTVRAGEVLDQDFAVALALAEIRGCVRRSEVPLAGAPVSASSVSAEGLVKRTFHASTDAQGQYVLAVAEGWLYDVRAGAAAVANGLLYDVRAGVAGLSGTRSRVPAGATGVNFDLPASAPGTLRVRLVDGQTDAPLRPARMAFGLFWRRTGEEGFEHAALQPDLEGRQDLTVEAGLVDVLVHATEEGYAPQLVEGVRVPANGESEIVTLALERGLAARLLFTGQRDAAQDLARHLIFLVEQEQLGQIEGPLTGQDGPASYNLSGTWMRLSSPTLLRQRVRVDTDGSALIQGLSPGRYHVRVYPDDFAFDPPVIELPAASAEPVAVRWRRR